MTGRYVFVRHPRPAWVDVTTPDPARFLVELSSHALNHGMPGMRRGGRFVAPLARRGLPVGAAAQALRRLPAGPLPRLDALLDEVVRAWGSLTQHSALLPPAPPPLSALAVHRASGWFVFVFAGSRHPSLLLKPGDADGAADRESRILETLAPLGIAPRPLPSVAGRRVQEGLPGLPVWVEAPARTGWSASYVPAFDALGERLVEVTRSTAVRATNHLDEHLALAASHVDAPTASVLRRIRRDLGTLDVGSLQHGDLSAQNWLTDGADLAGVVDWETADPCGVIGHDVFHTAVSLLENGVALRHWTEEKLVRTFRRAWHEEPLFERARAWNRECVVAATGSDRLADPLATAFFAERLGSSLAGDGPTTLSTASLTAMLQIVTTASSP